LNRDEDLNPFPIDEQIISSVKQRVNTARTLDKFLWDQRKEDAQKNWLKKAAEEAELELSEDDMEDESSQRKKADLKSKIKSTKAQLAVMLATPIHSQSYAGKYPTMSGKLRYPSDFKAKSKAVKAMLAELK